MLQILEPPCTLHTPFTFPQEKLKESIDDDQIKDWLACYNLKSRVRGLEDRSRLDDQTVGYLP